MFSLVMYNSVTAPKIKAAGSYYNTDQSQKTKNLCIMADIKLLTIMIHKQ